MKQLFKNIVVNLYNHLAALLIVAFVIGWAVWQKAEDQRLKPLQDTSIYSDPTTWPPGHIELQSPWPDDEPCG
jgi:hypothetical protein